MPKVDIDNLSSVFLENLKELIQRILSLPSSLGKNLMNYTAGLIYLDFFAFFSN